MTTEFVRRVTEASIVFLNDLRSDGYKFSIQLLRGLFVHPAQSAVFTLQGQ